MKMLNFLAIGLAAAMTTGCATSNMMDDEKPMEPNMTADLNVGDSADSILSTYGKPIYKKGRMDADGGKIEDWFYTNAMLTFKDGDLHAFKPK